MYGCTKEEKEQVHQTNTEENYTTLPADREKEVTRFVMEKEG